MRISAPARRRRAASRPWTYSSEAPPPVERWVMRSPSPSCVHGRERVAAADHGDGGALGEPRARRARVPAANAAISNTPIGPFQKNGARARDLRRVARGGLAGRCRRRASRPGSSRTTRDGAPAASRSRRRGRWAGAAAGRSLRARAHRRGARRRCGRARRARRRPARRAPRGTCTPWRRRSASTSACGASASSTASLSETLAPPSIDEQRALRLAHDRAGARARSATASPAATRSHVGA